MSRVVLEVRYVARFADGTTEKTIGVTKFPGTCDVTAASEGVRTMAGAIDKTQASVVFGTGATEVIDDPEQWPLNWERRGKILYAYYLKQKREDGIDIHPNNVRTEAGVIAKELSDQNPGLNVTLDEVVEILAEVADVLYEETFRRKRTKSSK